MTNYALLTDLSTKQETLLASATGSPLLKGSTLRSISAGTNVALLLQDNNPTVNVPSFRGTVVTVIGIATVPTSVLSGVFDCACATTGYTVTLPSSVATPAAKFDVNMSVSQITLSTPVGHFRGLSGTYRSTQTVPNALFGGFFKCTATG